MFTVPNSSCGKVMFSQASVILSTGREGHVWQRGACVVKEGGCVMRGHVWRGGACVSGGHAWQGACMAGVCMWWGCAWQRGMCGRGACKAGGRVCMAGGHAWQGGMHGRVACVAGETATAADGTHPTGMHSCVYIHLISTNSLPSGQNTHYQYLFPNICSLFHWMS